MQAGCGQDYMKVLPQQHRHCITLWSSVFFSLCVLFVHNSPVASLYTYDQHYVSAGGYHVGICRLLAMMRPKALNRRHNETGLGSVMTRKQKEKLIRHIGKIV